MFSVCTSRISYSIWPWSWSSIMRRQMPGPMPWGHLVNSYLASLELNLTKSLLSSYLIAWTKSKKSWNTEPQVSELPRPTKPCLLIQHYIGVSGPSCRFGQLSLIYLCTRHVHPTWMPWLWWLNSTLSLCSCSFVIALFIPRRQVTSIQGTVHRSDHPIDRQDEERTRLFWHRSPNQSDSSYHSKRISHQR